MNQNRNNRSNRPDTYESHSSSKRKKMPISAGRAALLTLSILFVALGAITVVAYQYMFAPLTVKAIDRSASALGIASNAQDDMKETGVTNIALFGVDSRDDSSDDGRSDSMIILSIDKTHSKVKLTSILRDSYVPIDGHGKEKITHAYAYGGAPLALRTVNENYNMDIQDYVTVNFAQFANLIDSVGGIDMDISDEEMKEMNDVIWGSETEQARDAHMIKTSGEQHLNGSQAVVYTRIREDDSDNARAGRQQKVLSYLLNKVESMPMTEYPALVRTAMGMCETSLSQDTILGYVPFLSSKPSMEQITVPDIKYETDVQGGIYGDAGWVWRYNLSNAGKRIRAFIYNET